MLPVQTKRTDVEGFFGVLLIVVFGASKFHACGYERRRE
jgi:hypothetical protein